jgi:hypothetical protein
MYFNDQFLVSQPAWVLDITYITSTLKKVLYLTTIMDLAIIEKNYRLSLRIDKMRYR